MFIDAANLDGEGHLIDAWEAGRAAWPGIELSEESFTAHLQACGGSGELHVGDLYLAAAVIARVPEAYATFERVFVPRLDPAIRRIDSSPAFIDEVRQQVRARVLVERADGRVRLADYRGRGPLDAWLRVAAMRLALDIVTAQHPERAQTLDEAVLESPGAVDPETELLDARYGKIIRGAVRDALVALAEKDRNLLRLHLLGGLTTAKLATMYRVNQSTIVRRLQAARAAVRAHTNAALCRELGTTPAELTSLARLLLSRLDMSVTALLGDPSPAA